MTTKRRIADFALGLFVIGAAGLMGAGCDAPIEGAQGADEGDISTVSAAISTGPVDVIEATYGANCGASRTNATWSVVDQCDGSSNCLYRISTGTLGDPKRGCDKNFDVRWACGTMGTFSVHVNGEANQQTVTLACQNVTTMRGLIRVQDATFGGNVGQPRGNATWDASQVCDGYGQCKYDISTNFLGDPARGRDKDYLIHWKCSNRGSMSFAIPVSPEASGKNITLICP